MPCLKKEHLEKEVKRVLADVPADSIDNPNDPYCKYYVLYQRAYDRGWEDLEKLLEKNR